MSTKETFLIPLGLFRNRVAYSNAYHTDFMVSNQSGAFLHHENEYPHDMIEKAFTESDKVKDNCKLNYKQLQMGDLDCCINNSTSNFYVTSVTTEKKLNTNIHQNASVLKGEESRDEENDRLQMCQCLDSLGWTKVFIDMRQNIPLGVNIQWLPWLRIFFVNAELTKTTLLDLQNKHEEKGSVTSKDVCMALSFPHDDHYKFPVGHWIALLVTQSRIASYITKSGRPFINMVSHNMMRDIVEWKKKPRKLMNQKI